MTPSKTIQLVVCGIRESRNPVHSNSPSLSQQVASLASPTKIPAFPQVPPNKNPLPTAAKARDSSVCPSASGKSGGACGDSLGLRPFQAEPGAKILRFRAASPAPQATTTPHEGSMGFCLYTPAEKLNFSRLDTENPLAGKKLKS